MPVVGKPLLSSKELLPTHLKNKQQQQKNFKMSCVNEAATVASNQLYWECRCFLSPVKGVFILLATPSVQVQCLHWLRMGISSDLGLQSFT